jgi:hypothetical protein
VNVLLLHLDGRLPNIALMRLAAHHRALGDDVTLRHAPTVAAVEPEIGDNFGRVYASAVFERTRPVAERLLKVRPDAIVGGTGFDVARTLESVGVTTLAQDYSVYPRCHFSIGFTQRGCRLRCPFCIVPRKEGAAREEQTIADIWRGGAHRREVVLLDNDFFGVSGWRARIEELRAGRYKVCFCQGINARMISEEAAVALASVDYRDASFKARRIYTAWDNREDERTLFRGLDRLASAGIKPDHVMVYLLVGYWPGETQADREYRRAKLRAWGARPYPMPYQRTRELVGFQRWVLGAYDKGDAATPSVPRISWDAWCRAKYQPAGLGDRSDAQRRLPLFDDADLLRPEITRAAAHMTEEGAS